MTPEQQTLYQRICDFEFDSPSVHFRFNDKLAQENGWTATYTSRVIDEYRRFAFLAVAAGHPISPSDAVDQAWHLHMLYTKSYWGEFCPNVLGRAFHHYPSTGGDLEQEKLHDWYAQTLQSYQHFFATQPPSDIWTPVEQHNPVEQRYARINLAENWVIPKQGGWQHWLVRWLEGWRASFMKRGQPTPAYRHYASQQDRDFSLPDFPLPERDPEDGLPELDTYSVAYLAGREKHLALAVVTKLLEQGYLKHVGEYGVLLPDRSLPVDAMAVEKAVVKQFAVSGKTTLDGLASQIKSEAHGFAESLEALQLVDNGWRFKIVAALFVIALLCTLVALSMDALLCFVLPFALISIGVISSLNTVALTSKGKRLLAQLQDKAPQADNKSLAILAAVSGLSILNGTQFDYLPALLHPPQGAGGGDGGGSGGGCGGGGCGGGGCGGGGCGGA